MADTTLTLKFRGLESAILERMIKLGLFNTKSEAIRSALVYYSLELGILGREKIWAEIKRFPKRNISPMRLASDLEVLENEV